MTNKIKSFSVGSTLQKGQLVALVIKFKFDDDKTELCSFGREQISKLVQALTEYLGYLQSRAVNYDANAYETTLRQNEPGLHQDDVEAPGG